MNYGSACPESFLRDGSIGYVYVGDGLRLREVTGSGCGYLAEQSIA